MDIVLGVSMTPTAVRMVLVEGDQADGVTVDHDTFEIPAGDDAATPGPAEQVVAAILGTRESAAESGHRLVSTGVAWTDRAAAAQVRDALRTHGIADVVLVSELHAASALAQAAGRILGGERTALILVEGSTATMAVVQTADGAVVKVQSGDLDVSGLVAGLGALEDPPQAVFVVGPDTAALRAQIAERTTLPVHAPDDAELALARGAALAGARVPKYEAQTVGLASLGNPETAPGATQMAPAGYMAPLGYSAVPDEDDVLDLLDDPEVPEDDAVAVGDDRKPFMLVGSALGTIFVVGVAALVISLAVSIRPAGDQRPAPGPTPAAPSSSQAPVAKPAPAPAPAPQTIKAPVPVVQVVPRTVYVTPEQQAPAPVVVPVAPAPVVIPVAPAPAPEQLPPAPVAPPSVAQIVPPWLRSPVLPQFPAGLTPNRSSGGQGSFGGDDGPEGSGGEQGSFGGGHHNPMWPDFPMPFN